MKKMILSGLIIACSVMVIVSFFMPWANASVSVTKAATGLAAMVQKELGGTQYEKKVANFLQKAEKTIDTIGNVEVKTTVSGYDIPTLVQKRSSRSALSFVQIFFKGAQGLEKKVMLVYLLPLFGVACIFLTVLALTNKLYIIGPAVIGGVISAGGFYKLWTTNFSGAQYQIILLNGMWYTLYAYLLICILSIVWLATER
jgi:hypothetical protein